MRILINEEAVGFKSEAPGETMDEISLGELEKAAAECVKREGLNPENMEVSLSFVGSEEIRELNRNYRNVDKVTDVLSFPMIEDFNEPMISNVEEPDDAEEQAEVLLGDVVICMERAQEQAVEYGHSLKREMVYLFVHSILHLLGYDHMEEEDKAEMRQREEEIMAFLKIERN